MIGLVIMVLGIIVIPAMLSAWFGMHIDARERDEAREEKRRAEKELEEIKRKEED